MQSNCLEAMVEEQATQLQVLDAQFLNTLKAQQSSTKEAEIKVLMLLENRSQALSNELNQEKQSRESQVQHIN